MFQTALSRFRVLSIIEGISMILLLFVAMPLKYMADIPQAVSVIGALHGWLFVAYIFMAVYIKFVQKWPITRLLLAFVASVVPFGPFVFDHYVLRSEQPTA
jgi:integral membrane protein